MATPFVIDVRPVSLFELEALESLPCGYVTADYRAPSLAVGLMSLEAKGPHCTLVDHAVGQILRLEDSADSEEGRYMEAYRP